MYPGRARIAVKCRRRAAFTSVKLADSESDHGHREARQAGRVRQHDKLLRWYVPVRTSMYQFARSRGTGFQMAGPGRAELESQKTASAFQHLSLGLAGKL